MIKKRSMLIAIILMVLIIIPSTILATEINNSQIANASLREASKTTISLIEGSAKNAMAAEKESLLHELNTQMTAIENKLRNEIRQGYYDATRFVS